MAAKSKAKASAGSARAGKAKAGTLTHLDARGLPAMVDVSAKAVTASKSETSKGKE